MIIQKHQEVYDNIAEMGQNDCESFKFKARTTGRTRDGGNTNDVEIAMPLKYLLK